MASIHFSGMASGLPPNIVDQIMDAERIPVKQMESKKGLDEDKLKLIGEFETKISDIPKSMTDMVSMRGFQNNKLTSGDPNVLNGVVDPEKSVPGSWQVEVLQLAQKPGALSTGFPDPNKTEIGTGYMKFRTEKGTKEVYINSNNNTLNGAATAINNAEVGLRAQVINDRKDKENPFKLMVSGLATGDDKQVSFPTLYLIDGDQDFEFKLSHPAQNAKVKVDGFEFETPDNTVKDIVPGVNLELKQANPGHPIAISVKEDYEAIGGKVKAFVDAYNAALSWVQAQGKLTKDKSGHERLGPLGGDGMIRSVESAMRGVIINPQQGVQSEIKRIGELGIQFNRNGTLDFSQDKFNKALTSAPKDVANFLKGDGFSTGFIPSVKNMVTNAVNSSSGPLGVRKRGIEDRIKQADQRIERKEVQLAQKEDGLRKKFSDLETKMSQLQSQGSAVNGMAQAMQQKG